jgi:hypothetical protein
MYRAMLLGAILSLMSAVPAQAAHTEEFHAVFSGFNEIGALSAPTGAIMSEGKGTLDLRLDRANQTLSFTLKFSGLSAPVTQSHIHFGKVHVAGGVMVFFCSSLPNPPPGTQTCPTGGGTVTGTISPANVLPVPSQNITAGDFEALADALESNTAYANIHTMAFPAGEIRAEIRRDFESHDD